MARDNFIECRIKGGMENWRKSLASGPLAVLNLRTMVGGTLIALVMGCGKPLPSLDGVNLFDWKNDKNGCIGLRKKMADQVIAQKDKLLALSETDIITLLGKPDQNELYKRNQKFYKYYFQRGPDCVIDSIQPKSMTLRFNAMGLAKEVTVE
jgi:hypothetical protein